jgi:hypothetical protein
VSTAEQNFALQLDALRAAGCEEIFEDHASGAKADRPGLTKVLGQIRSGETLVVWKLDRLGRSMAHPIETVRGLEMRGIGFRSLTEGIDTTTPGGTLIFHLFGALAQFERDLIRERTRAGLKAAEARPQGRAQAVGHAREAGACPSARRVRADGARDGPAAEGRQDRALQSARRYEDGAAGVGLPFYRTRGSLSCSDPS